MNREPRCPLCERPLHNKSNEGWMCECGEFIPSEFEVSQDESCETCLVIYCLKRKRPSKDKVKAIPEI